MCCPDIVLDWYVCVSIEDETSTVCVSTHFVPEEPFSCFHSWNCSVCFFTDLVHSVASWAKNLGWKSLFGFIDFTEKFRRNNCMIIDQVVERTINSIVNIKRLTIRLSTFTSIDFCGKIAGSSNHVAARFSDEFHFLTCLNKI